MGSEDEMRDLDIGDVGAGGVDAQVEPPRRPLEPEPVSA